MSLKPEQKKQHKQRNTMDNTTAPQDSDIQDTIDTIASEAKQASKETQDALDRADAKVDAAAESIEEHAQKLDHAAQESSTQLDKLMSEEAT